MHHGRATSHMSSTTSYRKSMVNECVVLFKELDLVTGYLVYTQCRYMPYILGLP